MEHPVVVAAALQHSVAPALVLLRWALHKDFCIIPKSKNSARLAENANVADFDLNETQINQLDDLDLGGMKGRLCWRRDEMRELDFD